MGADEVGAPSQPAPPPGSSPTNTTALFYRDRARQAEADANAATLDNVRTRWMRAAKAWDEMATRAEKTAERRSVNEEAKMIAEMMADD
ncbi:hypothetical protein GCM10009087_43650 [Sphingomonas oligophenolica]|uniref:hypothetical protein n=1 Tax=Sphingomonas oligophenolica TaxID=301154 RepID=UPI0031DFFED2